VLSGCKWFLPSWHRVLLPMGCASIEQTERKVTGLMFHVAASYYDFGMTQTRHGLRRRAVLGPRVQPIKRHDPTLIRHNINTFLIPIGSSKRRLAGLIPHLKYIHIVKYPLKYIHIVKYPGVAMVSNTTIIELKRMHIQYHYNIIAFFFFSMARQIEAMGEIVSSGNLITSEKIQVL
jgi:hypothetical protein